MKRLHLLTILCFAFILVACSKDDDSDGGGGNNNNSTAVSYINFDISGPTQNGTYEFIDAGEDDEFSTFGYFYSTDEDPDLIEDQIQFGVLQSYTEFNFLFVTPPEEGLHAISYGNIGGEPTDFILDITLSINDQFHVDEGVVDITALEIDGRYISHCKGTFSGTYYRNNLDPTDLHEISGEFEINR